jgi:hypothetical protein
VLELLKCSLSAGLIARIEREIEIMGNGPFAAVVMAVIWIVLFLIFRAIVLWYWRVNEGIALLKSIDEKLERIAGNTPESNGPYIR